MFKKLLYNLNIIEKEHWVQPFVYIDANKIRWLDKEICIKCKKKDYLDKLRDLEEKYENMAGGKYKGRVNFY